MNGQVSEEIAKRDSFFHSCWVLCKSRHPEYRENMDVIECLIAGYGDSSMKEINDDNAGTELAQIL